MSKVYDVAEIDGLIDDIQENIRFYTDKASDLYQAYQDYINNTEFRGDLAEASKSYISEKEVPLLEKIVEAQEHLLDLYKHMQESFCNQVDDAANAHIETATVRQVKTEITEFYDVIDIHGGRLEAYADELQSKFGQYVTFSRPTFTSFREKGKELIGGDDKIGFIQECLDKFEAFDEDETAYAKQMDFSGYVEEITKEIDRLNDALGDITVLHPNIDTVNLLMTIFKDKALVAKKVLERIKSMTKYLFGSEKKCTKCAYDPVNMCSGNYINERVDISLRGKHPLELKRVYNALSDAEGALGLGWTHSFEKRIYKDLDTITIDYPDGSKGSFVPYFEGENLYVEEHGEPGILEVLFDGYVIRQDSGVYERFDFDGYLIAMGDDDGENISLSYKKSKSGKRLLSKVEAKNKNSFTFSYYEDDLNKELIENVTDQSGRSVCYTYENRRLVEIKGLDGTTRKFTYDTSNRIKDVINPKGITAIINEYDSEGRTIKQSFPDNTVMTYEYDDNEKTTLATEQNGNQVIYTHDDFGRHIKTTYYDGTESFTYNHKNLKTSIEDKRGNSTRLAYDNRGRLTKIVDALGNRTSITYNKDGRPMALKGPKGEEYKYGYAWLGELSYIKNPLGETTRFFYEGGNILRIKNPNGAFTQFTHDERGNVNTITDPDGVTISYKYDDLNRVVETESADGAKTKYEYDKADRITKTIDALGNTREYIYDKSGKLISVKEPDGTEKNFEINVMGRASKIIDEEGRITEITYNVMGKQEKVSLPNGGVIFYEYDPLMRLTKVTDPEGRTTGYEYDPNGNVVAEYLGDIKVRSLEYDELNRVTKEIDALSHEKTYEYDENGNVTKVTDTLGNNYTREYDLLGRVTKEVDPLGNETCYTYTKLGDIESVTDAAKRKRSFEYTEAGKLKAIYFCDRLEQELTYDNVGRVEKRSFADGYEISYSYDVLSRVEKVAGSDGRCVSYEYDAMGRATKVVDGDSTTLYTYTATGRLKSVVDALGNETAYTYDSLDNLKSVQRAEGRIENVNADSENFPTVGEDGHVTIYEYNLAGQLTTVTDALGQKEDYTYNQYGLLTTKIDRDNYATNYMYNDLGVVSDVCYADGRSVALSYDELGRLKSFTDWLGTTVVERDELGRALSIIDYNGKKISYTYGKTNERTSIIYPDGKKVDYIYDDFLRLSELVDETSKTCYSYDDNNRLVEKKLPNGNSQRLAYLPGGYLKSLEMHDSKGIIDKYVYGYDNKGNRTEIDRIRRDLNDISGKYKYEYDLENRLTAVSLNGKQIRKYDYDAYGNRTSLVENDTRKIYNYDVLDRLTEVKELNSNSQAIVKTYDYDKRGNQTKEYVDGLLQKTFTFDAVNLLSHVSDVKKGEADYSYNGMGKRVAVTRPDEKIEYLLDLTKDYHNMLERSVNGETETYTYDASVVSMSKRGEDYFYMLDELGSGMYLTGTDGASVSTYAYDEFGRNIDPFTGKKQKPSYTKQGNIIQPLAFTGYQNDEMTDNYFAQARYYNAEAGRFVSRDKERFIWHSKVETLNLYGYCLNRPVDRVDYSGNWPNPDYLIKGFEAHIFMEAYAINEFGANCGTEHKIEGGSFNGNGKYGYADIIIFEGQKAEIYEIKPGSYSVTGANHSLGLLQLDGYVEAFNNRSYTKTDRRGASGATRGMSYNEEFKVAIPSLYKPGYYIVYRTYGDGLIIYDYQKSVPDKCEVREPEKEAVMRSMQRYLRISDETMEKIKVGGVAVASVALVAALLVLMADDATGLGAADDAAIPVLSGELRTYILYLLEYFGISESLPPCLQ